MEESKLLDFRQGEVRLKQVEEVPKEAKINKGEYILAIGKSNLHKHALEGKFVIKEFEQKKYVIVSSKARLKHEEHKTILLPKGNYLVQIQREYTPRGAIKIQD